MLIKCTLTLLTWMPTHDAFDHTDIVCRPCPELVLKWLQSASSHL